MPETVTLEREPIPEGFSPSSLTAKIGELYR
jgi:hypothetical protein